MKAGYILTGGKNRRMMGEKKLLLTYRGRRFLDLISDSMGNLGKIYLSVDDVGVWTTLLSSACDRYELVEDLLADRGPLGGIFSGLSQCEEEALVVAACDCPFIRRDHIERLAAAYEKKGGIILGSCEGRVYPLPGVYPRKYLPLIKRRIEEGNLRMMDFLKEAGYDSIELDKEAFININSPEDYVRMKSPGPFVFAVSGYKNSGKTTLISKLIPELKKRGYKVAVIKHDGHDFEPDVPGTDSFRHRKAGAYGTAVFSRKRFMITREYEEISEDLLMKAFPEADIILIEGLKDSSYPKYICDYPNKPLIDPEELAERISTMYHECV